VVVEPIVEVPEVEADVEVSVTESVVVVKVVVSH
jgi:hypothetical protein